MRVFSLTLLLLTLAACGGSNGPQQAMDRHVEQKLDALEATLNKAKDAEQEKSAFAEVDRETRELSLGLGFTLYDTAGEVVPVADWSAASGRLKGGRIEIRLTYRDRRLARTINHTLIDPVNIVFLMRE